MNINISAENLQLTAGLVCVAGEGMVRAELLYVQFGFVQTQPEVLIDSGLGWGWGEGGEEELILRPHTPPSSHVTAHPVRTAVRLVRTAGGGRVGTTTDTCGVRGLADCGCGQDSP